MKKKISEFKERVWALREAASSVEECGRYGSLYAALAIVSRRAEKARDVGDWEVVREELEIVEELAEMVSEEMGEEVRGLSRGVWEFCGRLVEGERIVQAELFDDPGAGMALFSI